MHQEIRDQLDAALASPHGLRLEFLSKSDAHTWRMTAYTVRRRDHSLSRQIYPPGHPAYDTSPYDALIIKFDGTGRALTIEPRPPGPAVTTLSPPPRPVPPGSST